MSGINRKEYIEIFHRMYKPVRNFVYYKTGDMDLSDDIAQDSFLRIWEKREQIRLETAGNLLFTIASNLCINRFEHQQVVYDFASRFVLPDSPVAPDFELELKEFSTLLSQAIARLKENDRVVFLMNRIDGHTYREIADNLGLSVKTIEKRMKNALDQLKNTIQYKF